ncbi:MAG TPA: GNAT family N-acetyltransferase [Fredinandcohnia sp.]|nr:GNAT family N-acetyltransferase [Fredinandcohnia sp.]
MHAHTREVDPLAEVVLRTEDDFLAIGCEEFFFPFGRALRDPQHPLIYDVNCLRAAVGRPSMDELWTAFRKIGGRSTRYQRVVSRAPETIRWLDELLLPRGFSRQACVAMVHRGGVPRAPVPEGYEIHLVDREDRALIEKVCASQDSVRRKEAWYGTVVSEQMDEMALRQMRLGGAEFLAAVTRTGRVAGSLLLWCHDGVGFIADVGTVPSHRRKGIASALVAAATVVAREKGCDLVALTARRDDAPRRIYERLDFQVVGESVDWVRSS